MKLNTEFVLLLESIFIMLVSAQYLPTLSNISPVIVPAYATLPPIGNVNSVSSYQSNVVNSAIGNVPQPLVSTSFQAIGLISSISSTSRSVSGNSAFSSSVAASPSYKGSITSSNTFSNLPSISNSAYGLSTSTSISNVAEGSSSGAFGYNLLPPQAVINGFTKALLEHPSLQKYLNIAIPGHQAAELHFNIAKTFLSNLGNPIPVSYGKLPEQNFYKLDFVTVPLLLLLRANVAEKFLLSKGVVITPALYQIYANYTKDALESTDINDNEAVLFALLDGPKKFLQSLGFDISENAIALATSFNNELSLFTSI